MITLNNINKSFSDGKVKALRDVNIHIKPGEIFGIIGLSGAGKSTLVRCLNLLERPDSGQVIVDGDDLQTLTAKALNQKRQTIGMIFQSFNLLQNSTVSQNIAFPLSIAGWRKQDIQKRVAELLVLVGLEDKADGYPAQLSGGQRQRVGIARALATHPKIILCDEATSALDPQNTKAILDLIKRINQQLGVTVVIISHEPEVITQMCDSVAVIDNGQVVEQGSLLNIFTNPQFPLTREFFNDLSVEMQGEAYAQAALGGTLIKAVFIGESAEQPLLTQMAINYKITASVLAANIQQINSTSVGALMLRLEGPEPSIHQGLKFLQNAGVQVHVIRQKEERRAAQ